VAINIDLYSSKDRVINSSAQQKKVRAVNKKNKQGKRSEQK